jgi:hypothetical protein
MEITSTFKNNEKIPDKYTCNGININPPIKIIDYPEKTKSFALIVDDPDAPTKVWIHWIVFNITKPVIEENRQPFNSKRGINDSKKLDYSGPCPPSGTHRYFFKVYALDCLLDFNEGINKEMLEKVMRNHILAKTELIGLYSRK